MGLRTALAIALVSAMGCLDLSGAEKAGTLRIVVKGPDGERYDGARIRVSRRGEFPGEPRREKSENGVVVISGLAPGYYTIYADAKRLAADVKDISIEAGGVAEVVVSLFEETIGDGRPPVELHPIPLTDRKLEKQQ